MIRKIAALICLVASIGAETVVSRATFELAPEPARMQPALTGGGFEVELTEARASASVHSGEDHIVVTAPGPAPRISVVFQGGECVLRWERNSAFVLESTDEPAGGQWALVENIESAPAHFQHTFAGPERRFFRLILRQVFELRD